MFESLLDQQDRLSEWIFFGSVIIVALWELLLPRRALDHKVPYRWSNNISIGIINLSLVAVIMPVGALVLALTAETKGWGLLQAFPLPDLVKILLGVLALDLTYYLVHRLYHRLPLLWRLHQVHHADLDIDFTTANRHHPFEAGLSGAIFLLSVLVLGAPPVAVLLFQLSSVVSTFFAHGNLRLPASVDQTLRLVLVTPDMHAVHHSALRAETDSNYGQIFSFWDRLFGTYCAQPKSGLASMTIGLEYFRDARDLRIDRILVMPFIAPPPRPATDGVNTAARP